MNNQGKHTSKYTKDTIKTKNNDQIGSRANKQKHD